MVTLMNSNAFAASCAGDLANGYFPTVDDFIQGGFDGLRVVRGKLVGSLEGSRLALVVFKSTLLHGIQFIVNDGMFRWRMQDVDLFASGNNVYLRSSFLQNPQISWLLHEIKHTTAVRKKSLARLIYFEPRKSSLSKTDLLFEYKKSGYRFDELESWVIDGVSAGETLDEAINFAIDQRLILHYAINYMREGAARITYDIEGGFLRMDVAIRKPGEPEFLLGRLWFPSEQRFNFYQDQRDYILNLIAIRLSQLDAFGPRLQGD